VTTTKNWMAHATRGVLAVALCASLISCGGAGGSGDGDGEGWGNETLYPSFSMTGEASLLHPSTVRAVISGLDGHSPRCAIVGGRVPTGMTLNRNCNLTGTPTEIGGFQFSVELGASGVKNELVFQASAYVAGPEVDYLGPIFADHGREVDVRPLNNSSWTAQPGDTVTYAIVEGALPAGLAMEPTTGRVHGAASSEGRYAFKMSATLTNSAGTASVTSSYNTAIIVGPQPVQ